MIKIAFILNFSQKTWNGGFNFFENLIFFLKKYKKNIQISIITDNKKNFLSIKSFKNLNILETNLVSNKFNIKRFFDKILIFFFGRSYFLEKFLLKNKIKILSHSLFCGKNSKIKSFPWYPDFQHLYFPENFTFKNRLFRNLNVYMSSIHSNRIIVSSQSVKKDIKKISNNAYKITDILYHTNRIIDFQKIHDLEYLKKKFKIKKNFFLLPNHYWTHKNHFVVLKALNIINDPNFQILSTGMLLDHRDRNHIKRIQKYIIDNNLKNSYKILDLVTFRDLCSLMKHCIAVINPSLCEGWGNSADQARKLGKPCILSNIPVHKELNYKYTKFFNPHDYKKLSRLMLKMSSNHIKINFKNDNSVEKKYVDDYLKIILN
jgi:hypothetical protein